MTLFEYGLVFLSWQSIRNFIRIIFLD